MRGAAGRRRRPARLDRSPGSGRPFRISAGARGARVTAVTLETIAGGGLVPPRQGKAP
jgi:hypothetical protein